VVSVGGRPITVDESGGFVQLMSVSAEGETTIFVRADAVGHAPRLVPLRVRRVHSLRGRRRGWTARSRDPTPNCAEGSLPEGAPR
jgi:hypothetical protein